MAYNPNGGVATALPPPVQGAPMPVPPPHRSNGPAGGGGGGGRKHRHDDEEQGKLFVGGLSWDTTQETLLRYFSRFGEVIDCVVMKNTESMRSRGFGFVTFADPANIDAVLATCPHTLDGRTIDPKNCNPRSMQKPKRSNSFPKVFLGGLPSSITETDLRSFFSRYGEVCEVVIMFGQEKKKSRGFGFLSFADDVACSRAVAEHFVNIQNKQVEIKKAEPRTTPGGGNMMDLKEQHPQQHIAPPPHQPPVEQWNMMAPNGHHHGGQMGPPPQAPPPGGWGGPPPQAPPPPQPHPPTAYPAQYGTPPTSHPPPQWGPPPPPHHHHHQQPPGGAGQPPPPQWGAYAAPPPPAPGPPPAAPAVTPQPPPAQYPVYHPPTTPQPGAPNFWGNPPGPAPTPPISQQPPIQADPYPPKMTAYGQYAAAPQPHTTYAAAYTPQYQSLPAAPAVVPHPQQQKAGPPPHQGPPPQTVYPAAATAGDYYQNPAMAAVSSAPAGYQAVTVDITPAGGLGPQRGAMYTQPSQVQSYHPYRRT